MKPRDSNDVLRDHGAEGLRQALDEAPRKARQGWEKGKRNEESRAGPQVLPPPHEPMAVARAFLNDATHDDGTLKLRHWRGDWWSWKGSHWRLVDARAVRKLIYGFTEHAIYPSGRSFAPWSPTRRKINDVLDAMEALALLSRDVEQPAWLDEREAGTIVACTNGLYNVTSGILLPHTPQFFNMVAVPFPYDGSAPRPNRWLEFLRSLWPDGAPEIDVLSEWFGYVLSGRRDLHKILLMIGSTRGGKGVIARVLISLIGRQNVAGPTLNSLSGEFGLAPFIGKPLAIISDARLDGRSGGVIVERLLSISGEDQLTVNIKYREQWTGTLPTRLHVISNELPRFGDASAAIIGRLMPLMTTRSWLGNEDFDLEPTLHRERTGIFNWSLEGLSRLSANGWRFTVNPSATDIVVQLRDLASPIGAFVRERCELKHDGTVPVELLYATWKLWAENNGHPRTSKPVFGRDLRAACPMVRITQPRDGDLRIRAYAGIALKPEGEENNDA